MLLCFYKRWVKFVKAVGEIESTGIVTVKCQTSQRLILSCLLLSSSQRAPDASVY